MKTLLEHQFIAKLTENFLSSPLVINHPFESDAEIIQFDNYALAITTDSIVEEIELGLYDDPFLMGWMAVVSNLSDLAAVGAQPIGLLIQESFPKDQPVSFIESVQDGIVSACDAHETFILGGDTNSSTNFQIGATAIGTIASGTIISRKGIKEGDLVYVSDKLGVGNAFAFQKLTDHASNEINYQPQACINEGKIIRKYGSSCIDTSDGFFPAVATIMSVNGLGINIQLDFKKFIEQNSINMMADNNIPNWFLLAGPHGEFELLFTIPSDKNEEFHQAAKRISWSPIKIGTIRQSPNFSYLNKKFDPFLISNLFAECENDVIRYIDGLNLFEKKWQLSK